MSDPLPDGVTLTTGHGDLPMVHVETPAVAADVYLYGAHLTSWVPAGEREVLYLSPEAIFDGRAAIRGGVPLCGPWFGKGPRGDKSPSHGWFRTSEWTLALAVRDGDAVTLTFTLEGPGAQAAYVMRLGRSLGLSLTVTATEQLELETAFHLYAAVSDARRVSIEGLDAVFYRDTVVGQEGLKIQSGPVEFIAETDRVYQTLDGCTLVDPGWQRRVVLEKENSGETVVWNPWSNRAAELKDMPDDDWTRMVCVEAAHLGEHAVTLQPGQFRTMRAVYSLAH